MYKNQLKRVQAPISGVSVLTLLFISIVFGSCIERLDLSLGEKPVLVVDGMVTTEQKQHQVKLAFSTGFNKNPIFQNTVKEAVGATINLMDDLGNSEILTEIEPATYVTTPTYQAVIGRAYHLEITLINGLEYVTIPEMILPSPAITGGSHKIENRKFLSENAVSEKPFFVFGIDFMDNPAVNNYYRWRYQENYQVLAPLASEECEDQGGGGPMPIVAGPGENCEFIRHCWAIDFDSQFLRISDDALFDGQNVTDMEIYSRPVSRNFLHGYSGYIQQYSLTEGAYTYFKSIKNQIGNTGSIFETSNYQLRGNVRSATNPDEAVIGYFQASDVEVHRLFVAPNTITFDEVDCTPSPDGTIPLKCKDCRAFPASNVKPSFWPW